MKPLTMNEHLAIARDHGISIPVFRYAKSGTFIGADGVALEQGTVHYTDCDHLAGTAVTAVEDLPVPAWGMANCNHCWSLDNSASDGVRRTTELFALQQVTTAATDSLVTAQVATVPGAIEALNRDERDDFLEEYANTCYQLRRRTALDGRSWLQDRWTPADNAYWGVDDGATTTPLLEHISDLADDLTRRWQTVIADLPYRAHLLRDQPAGTPQVRLARRTPPDWSLDPTMTVRETMDAVLLAEAPRIAVHGAWEVVAWNSSLHRWTPDGAATHADWTPQEIDHALAVCANNPDGGTFADVLPAIRAAHAA